MKTDTDIEKIINKFKKEFMSDDKKQFACMPHIVLNYFRKALFQYGEMREKKGRTEMRRCPCCGHQCCCNEPHLTKQIKELKVNLKK